MRTVTGRSISVKHQQPRAGDVRDSLASLTKIERVLGYKPVVDLDTGLAHTINYFRN